MSNLNTRSEFGISPDALQIEAGQEPAVLALLSIYLLNRHDHFLGADFIFQ